MRDNWAKQYAETKFISIEMPLTVNTYDIDVAGHVNNIVYIRWLEDLRNKLFSQNCSLEKLLKVYHYPVVISTDAKYKRQVKLFDKPDGKIFLHNYSHGMFVFKAEINIDNHIVFTAIQKCVLVNLTGNRMFKGSINDLVKHYSSDAEIFT